MFTDLIPDRIEIVNVPVAEIMRDDQVELKSLQIWSVGWLVGLYAAR